MRVLFALLALAASVATVSAQGWTGPNFYIVGASGTASYNFSIDGTIVNNPSFNLTVGPTYKFFINKSMDIHPFGFADATNNTMVNSTFVTLSGSCGSSSVPSASPFSWITTNETNPCIVSLTPPADAVAQGPVKYRCSLHGSMFGTLTPVAAGTGTGGGSGSSSSSSSSSSSPAGNGTTPTPTATPVPTGSSSSGRNGAAVIVPGAAALIIAAINALFSV